MYQILEILPGVTLRHMHATRFKQGCMSIQFLRPMTADEAGQNALIPAILLRGCQKYTDLQQITQRLDELYGASISTLVRRIGDYQSTGFYCSFMEDRFALQGDAILAPMLELTAQLLLDPLTEDGGFRVDFTESEKRNLIGVIESDRSNKGAYAAGQLLKLMCANDSYGIPRLGEVEQIRTIDHKTLWAHYQKVLRESPVEVFFVGSAPVQQVADLVGKLFAGIQRDCKPLPKQTAYCHTAPRHETEAQQIAQGNLCMGFTTPIINTDPRFAAMQLCNAIFGAGQTSKLFMQVREQMSLCYAIGSGYYGSKGILTVGAGIDTKQEQATRKAILVQLEACRQGNVTQDELTAAKESILSGLRTIYDTPGTMEGYFSVTAISGLDRDPETYARQIRAVTLADVTAAAQTLQPHSTFFLKGAIHEEA